MSDELRIASATRDDVLYAAAGMGWPALRVAGVAIGAGEVRWREAVTEANAARIWDAWHGDDDADDEVGADMVRATRPPGRYS